MKKEYISPIIKSEELVTKDSLLTSKPDNQNNGFKKSNDLQQDSLLGSMADFVFGDD